MAIPQRDLDAIERGLARWTKRPSSEEDGFVAHRTRAFAYLMRDGALRIGEAVRLTIEDLIENPKAKKLAVKSKFLLKATSSRKSDRTVFVSPRAREPLAEYATVLREMYFPDGTPFQGPFFISARGGLRQLSNRTAAHWWKEFQERHVKLSETYQLEDLIYTGRKEVLQSSDSPQLLSSYTGMQSAWTSKIHERMTQEEDAEAKLEKFLAKLHSEPGSKKRSKRK